MAEIRIDAQDVQGPVELRVGDTLVIDLQENPTTGYRWQASAGAYLVPSSDQFLAPADAAMGATGIRRLGFGVVSAGKGEIQLQLRREWETGSPQRSFNIPYEVK